MILFKRVGESFRQIDDREWLLLFLETLGVLVGILLAFELQEWGQRRAEEARHRQLMARLFEESELDVAVLRDMRDLLDGLLDGERKFAAALGNGRCPPQSEWEAVQNVGKLPALTAPTFVYQELMGAGGLSAVERKDVRQALAVFHRDLDWTQQQVAYFRQSNQDPISTSDPRVTISYDPTKDDPEVRTYDRAALCADHGFKNVFASSLRQHLVFTGYHQGMLEDAIGMCIRLGDASGQACVPAFGGPLKGSDEAYAGKELAKMRRDLARHS